MKFKIYPVRKKAFDEVGGIYSCRSRWFKATDKRHLSNGVYLLKFSQEKIRAAAQGAAIPHLSKTFVNSIKIPLPPLVTQKQIVAKFSAVQGYKKQLLEQKTKLKELFDSSLAKSMK